MISFLFFFFLPDIFSEKARKQCCHLTIFFSLLTQITSHGRKCVRAKAGLNPYDKKAEIIRESCNGHSDMIKKRPGPVLTRLFFKNIQKYVCFDRCGRLRTKVIHNSYSVVSPVKTMRLHKILSVTLIIQITSKSKFLFVEIFEFRHFTKTKYIALSFNSSFSARVPPTK